MVFNSFAYLWFFIAILIVYFASPARLRWIIVLVGSYYFYMSFRPVYGALLFGTTFVNWLLVFWMLRVESARAKKTLLVGNIAFSLTPLIFFKYFNFISVSLWDAFRLSGDPFLVHVVLPIGISFYTFQSIAYMVDVYRGAMTAETNLFRYAAFVAFFPHLVSGPILKPSSIIPQLHETKRWSGENTKTGIFLIATGLVKKVVIADSLSFLVDKVYAAPVEMTGATIVLATYLFAFQLYCDFSGYTDIAIGSAKILGYHIPDNFEQPYLSTSIAEFWRRWHISLSTWFREYFFYPLSFALSRVSRISATSVGIFATFLVMGFWHGAGWTYVTMGALFGAYIVLSTFTRGLRARFVHALGLDRFPFLLKLWRTFVTFNLVCCAWIFFRSSSFPDALAAVGAVFTNFGSVDATVLPRIQIFFALLLIGGLLFFDILERKTSFTKRVGTLPWYYHAAFVYFAALMLMAFGVQQGPRFIYFQF